MTTLTPKKPRSATIKGDKTSLPRLTRSRRPFRSLTRIVCRLLLWLHADVGATGIENIPRYGPALIVTNRLGDADGLLVIAYSRYHFDWLVKSELYDIPILGKIIDAYGVIWIRRCQPDRAALRVALEGLAEDRCIGIAPEGRESLTGSLEAGTFGAAYLALKTDVTLNPVIFTGTMNKHIYSNMKRLHRTKISVTIGLPFQLDAHGNRHTSMQRGTRTIMETLARQLPPKYRGEYKFVTEIGNDG
jgi:1-acyl-sn-glycerol-3-phosphate acyltransferase